MWDLCGADLAVLLDHFQGSRRYTSKCSPANEEKLKFIVYQADLFSVRSSLHFSDRRDLFFVVQRFSGFFWCAGFKGGKPGTNWVSRKVELGDGGCQKMGRFAWGVGVAAASRELPKRFLDENWFWSYDWKVP